MISDRTYYSSITYQGRARGLGEHLVREINEAGLDGLVPGRVFVIEVDPDTALGRQHRPDRIGSESIDFQMEVRSSYRDLAMSDPVEWSFSTARNPLISLRTRSWSVSSMIDHFEGVVGHSRVVDLLRQDADEPANAYLFFGPGIGGQSDAGPPVRCRDSLPDPGCA